MLTLREKLAGGLIGLLVGDALGVPYEFHAREEIPALTEIEFEPPKGFRRAHAGVPTGTWSDDGAQALVLLASLLECGKMDLDHFAKGLVDWYDKGYMAVDGHVFDVGLGLLPRLVNAHGDRNIAHHNVEERPRIKLQMSVAASAVVNVRHVGNPSSISLRVVQTGDIFSSSILVTEGLRAGEEVVTAGASFLYEGAPVEVATQTTMAAK